MAASPYNQAGTPGNTPGGMDTSTGYGYNAPPATAATGGIFAPGIMNIGSNLSNMGGNLTGAYQMSGAYPGMMGPDMSQVNGVMQQILRAMQAGGGGGGGGAVGGIDPGLINAEYDIRRQIAGMGTQQNNNQFQSSVMDWNRLLASNTMNMGMLGNQIQDIGIQKRINSNERDKIKNNQLGITEQQNQLGIRHKQDVRDLYSDVTAKGAFGSSGFHQKLGTMGDMLASQLRGLDLQNTNLGIDIGNTQWQDQRFGIDLQNVGLQQAYQQALLQSGYGDLMIAGSNRDLANQLVGMNTNLLNNTQQQQLANNSNAATNAANANSMASMNANNGLANAVGNLAGSVYGSLLGGFPGQQLNQGLTRAAQGQSPQTAQVPVSSSGSNRKVKVQ